MNSSWGVERWFIGGSKAHCPPFMLPSNAKTPFLHGMVFIISLPNIIPKELGVSAKVKYVSTFEHIDSY